MACEHLYLETEGEIARVVIDRPAKRNAMSLEMWRAVPALMAEVERDPQVKLAIVQGVDERCFAAGADISDIAERLGDADAGEAYIDDVHAAERSIADCAKPTIAMIQGECIGGGVELALACDLRFASTDSRFGVTPAKLGICYSMSSTRRLVQLIGPGMTKDILFTGRLFDAAEAARIGLVDRVVPPGDIVAETQAMAEAICRGSQYSVRHAKRNIRAIIDGAATEPPDLRQTRIDAFLGEDLREGASAYLKKRKPDFTFG